MYNKYIGSCVNIKRILFIKKDNKRGEKFPPLLEF